VDVSAESDDNGRVSGVRVVSNQMYDCTDGVQLVKSGDMNEPRYPNAVIAHNDFYISQASEFQAEGGKICAENAVDIKGAGTSNSDRVKVIGNRMWGYSAGYEPCGGSGTGPFTNAVIIHNEDGGEKTKHVEVKNNIIFETSSAVGLEGTKQIDIVNNILYSASTYQGIDAYALSMIHRNEDINIQSNTLTEGETWIATRFEPSDGSLENNVFADAGGTDLQSGGDFSPSGNIYYGNSEPLGGGSNGGSVSEANNDEFCVTLKAYTDPTERCFENSLSTSDSPHGTDKGFYIEQSQTSSSGGEVNEDALYLRESFEDGEGWFGSHRVPSEHDDEAVNYVDSPVSHGSQAMRLHAKNPDQWDYSEVNSYRVEKALFPHKEEMWNDGISVHGEPFWFAFSVYIPESWETTEERRFENIAEFHANWDPGEDDIYDNTGSANRKPFELVTNTKDNEFYFTIINGYQDSNGDPTFDSPRIDAERGRWHEFVVHTKWARYGEEDGFMEVWHNGNKVYDHEGNTVLNNEDPPRPLKLSIYNSRWNSIDLEERTLFYDDVRIADGDATYDDIAKSSTN
jgi:hypothetical protein